MVRCAGLACAKGRVTVFARRSAFIEISFIEKGIVSSGSIHHRSQYCLLLLVAKAVLATAERRCDAVSVWNIGILDHDIGRNLPSEGCLAGLSGVDGVLGRVGILSVEVGSNLLDNRGLAGLSGVDGVLGRVGILSVEVGSDLLDNRGVAGLSGVDGVLSRIGILSVEVGSNLLSNRGRASLAGVGGILGRIGILSKNGRSALHGLQVHVGRLA